MPTIPDEFLDLTERPVATIATVGSDGRPQLSAVWFLFDEGKLRVSLNRTRQKTKNLIANPAATLFILDESGYRYLEVRGDVTIEADDDYQFADRVGAKYNADLRQMDGPGESRVSVTFDPVRVNAVNMSGG
ncbi:MAG: PPOX class F420-dependent oxidoreductase [Microthrixaceae bacterium]